MASSNLFSPNCSQTPAQVPPTSQSKYDPINPFRPGRTWQDLQTPHNWTKPFGWIGFIPKIPLYSMYPFDDLMTIPTLVHNSESGNYSLPEKTILKWTQLSISLRTVIEKLGAVYKVPYVAPYPARAWKYGEEGKHRQVLWWCHRSREWFMVWSGLLAFQINVIHHQGRTQISPLERDPHSGKPPHWKVTVRELGFSEGFIDGLECLASDGIPRAGIVFDSPSQDPYFQGQHPNVSLWVQAGVPVWYRSHENKQSLVNPVLTSHTEMYGPSIAPPQLHRAPQLRLTPGGTDVPDLFASSSQEIIIQDSPASPTQVPSSTSSPYTFGSSSASPYIFETGPFSPVSQWTEDMVDATALPTIIQRYPTYPSELPSGADALDASGCCSTLLVQTLDDGADGSGLEGAVCNISPLNTDHDNFFDPELVEARSSFMRQQVQAMLQKEQSRIAKENTKEMRARRNREQEPATASAIIIEWDIDPDNLMEMKSRPVPRRERLDTLDSYHGRTRRYFPSSNVWWCCDGIDIGEIDYGTDEWDDERDVPPQAQSSEALDNTPTICKPLQEVQIEDHPQDYYRQASNDYDISIEIENVRAEIMEDLNILRGYIPPLELEDYQEYEKWNLSEGERVVFARVLGFAMGAPGVVEFLQTHLAFAIYKLYMAFNAGSRTRSLYIRQVYDLEWECRQPIVREGYFQTLKVFTQHNASENTGKTTRLYLFDRKEYLTLGVASPVLALAVVRLSRVLSSLDSIVLRLLDLGVPFQVFGYRGHTIPRPQAELLPVFIPSRPAGYKFSKEDYDMYRRNLDNCLAHPRMRAALLRGGYIWRIATSCVSATEVLRGPSSEANAEIRDRGMGGAFVGDELTRDELAAIVGTYQCTNPSNKQTELRSWWPPVHVYEDEKYGENLFRWTAWRERGYQDRLKEIGDSTAIPLTNKQWRQKMKGRREWAAWRQVLTKDSSEYIEKHLPRSSFVSTVQIPVHSDR